MFVTLKRKYIYFTSFLLFSCFFITTLPIWAQEETHKETSFERIIEFPALFRSLNRIHFEQVLTENFKRITVPVTISGQFHNVFFFKYLEGQIYSVAPKAKLYLGPDFILKILGYLYERLHKEYNKDPQSMPLSVLRQTQEALPAFEVFPLGTDYNFIISANSKNEAQEITKVILDFVSNIRRTYKLQNEDTNLESYLLPTAHVLSVDEHMFFKRKHGGSTLDFLLFDLEKGTFLAPQDYDSSLFSYKEDIVKNLMEGQFSFIKSQDKWAISSHALALKLFKTISTMLEVPFLSLDTEEAFMSELLFFLKPQKFDQKTLRLIHKELIKISKAVRNEFGINRFLSGKEESLEKKIAQFLKVIESEKGLSSIPKFLEDYGQVEQSKEDFRFKEIKNLLFTSHDEKFYAFFPYNKVYHRTILNNAPTVLKEKKSSDVNGLIVALNPKMASFNSTSETTENITITFDLNTEKKLQLIDLTGESDFIINGAVPKHKGLAFIYIDFLLKKNLPPSFEARDLFCLYLVEQLKIDIFLVTQLKKTAAFIINNDVLESAPDFSSKLEELYREFQKSSSSLDFSFERKLQDYDSLLEFFKFENLLDKDRRILEIKEKSQDILARIVSEALVKFQKAADLKTISALIKFKSSLKSLPMNLLDSYLDQLKLLTLTKKTDPSIRLLALIALDQHEATNHLSSQDIVNIFENAAINLRSETSTKQALLLFSSSLNPQGKLFSLMESTLENILKQSVLTIKFVGIKNDTPVYFLLLLKKIISSLSSEHKIQEAMSLQIQIFNEDFSSYLLERLLRGQGASFHQSYMKTFELFKKFDENTSEESFIKFLFSKEVRKKDSHRFSETILDQIFFNDKASFQDRKLAYKIKISQDLAEQRIRFIAKTISSEFVSTLKKIELRGSPDGLFKFRSLLFDFLSEEYLRPLLFEETSLEYLANFFLTYKNKSELFHSTQDLFTIVLARHLLSLNGASLEWPQETLKAIGKAILLEYQLKKSIIGLDIKTDLGLDHFFKYQNDIKLPIQNKGNLLLGAIPYLLTFLYETESLSETQEEREMNLAFAVAKLYELSKNFLNLESEFSDLNEIFLSGISIHPLESESFYEHLKLNLKAYDFPSLDQIKRPIIEKSSLTSRCSRALGTYLNRIMGSLRPSK